MFASTKILAVVGLALLARVSNGLPPRKIVGGSTAAPGEFPYQVSMRVNGEHFCGGTIVSNRHIITAAHCVTGLSPYGLAIATGTTSPDGGELHPVSKIVAHPYYQPENTGSPNDIAIITLADTIRFNRNQNKLDLPHAPTPAGVSAVVSGWGYRTASVKTTAPTLLKVRLNTIDGYDCQQMFGRSETIYESQICTYNGPGVGTCNGDSGGPLAANGQLIGVVSWGIPCAIGAPDVFTSTYHYLDWIHQNMNSYY